MGGNAAKHIIIGTAGHIDHGKTALLKALTGHDADRLPEEQRRGLTIDLGYVFYDSRVSIVDVPGHEKFIKNMLAGAATIDLAILVVAADDGVMPQTREHLDILRLLEVPCEVVALTKTDLVEPDWLELVKEEIAGLVEGAFPGGAQVIPVSSVTGEGIDRLREALEREIDAAPGREDKGVFRYWIDRSFVLTGVGHVVTGTVLSGRVSAGDTLELLPQGRQVRARKLQTQGEDVESCGPGQRTAINLVGVDSGEIERGDLLAAPGYFRPTWMVNCRLRMLDGAPPLENRARVRFHVGCRELFARVVPLEGHAVAPGSSAVVQFRLEEQAALDTGDRFVIRRYSPPRTIGGGTVLEIDPPKLKYLPEEEARGLERLEGADLPDRLLHRVEKRPLAPHTAESLSRELAAPPPEVKSAMETLVDRGELVTVGGKPELSVAGARAIEGARHRVLRQLREFHETNPYVRGIKRSELRNRALGELDADVFAAIVEPLVRDGEVAVDGEKLRLAGREVEFAGEDRRIADLVERAYADAGLATPSTRELADRLDGAGREAVERVVRGLVEQGRLVEIRAEADERALFHADEVARAESVLVDLLRQNGEITVSDFRKALDTSRKYATPLLVYFDQRGLTVRDGGVRRLKNQ